jgi:intracellular septation protein
LGTLSAEAPIRTALFELFADFLSALVFLLVNALTHDVVLATLAGIAVALGQCGWAWFRRQPMPTLRWLSLVLVLLLGGATIFTADSRFIRWKPTLIHFAIAGAMLQRGWQQRYLPALVKEWVSDRELAAWGYVWAAAMLAMGIINAAAAQWLEIGPWGMVVTLLLLAKGILFGAQYAWMRIVIGRRIRAAGVAVPTPSLET